MIRFDYNKDELFRECLVPNPYFSSVISFVSTSSTVRLWPPDPRLETVRLPSSVRDISGQGGQRWVFCCQVQVVWETIWWYDDERDMELIFFVCCKFLEILCIRKPPIFKMFLFPRIPFGKSVKTGSGCCYSKPSSGWSFSCPQKSVAKGHEVVHGFLRRSSMGSLLRPSTWHQDLWT